MLSKEKERLVLLQTGKCCSCPVYACRNVKRVIRRMGQVVRSRYKPVAEPPERCLCRRLSRQDCASLALPLCTPVMGSQQSTKASSMSAAAAGRHNAVSKDAMRIPLLTRLAGKRVVLASASPRRREILAGIGLRPEIVASTFAEDLPKSAFIGAAAFEYPVETSSHKALEVYRRLVEQSPEDPPDLVISADTVVVKDEEILEKPLDAMDNMRMLADLNDDTCEVITGVTIIHPTIESPGYKVHSLSERTKVRFATNDAELLQAYVDSGEGLDRAGGFAIQGKAAFLIRGIEGDYNNVVGFPLHSFCSLMHELIDSEQLTFV